MFEPLLGIKLHTYGENGEKLIKALENNTPNENKEKIATIIQVVELFKPYSKSIIGLRTTAQHYKNIQMSPIIAEFDHKGAISILVPRTSEKQTAKEFSEVIYHNIFVFVRDLMVFSYASKFYKAVIPVVIEEKGRIKKIGVTISDQGN